MSREGPFRLHESVTSQENKFSPYPAFVWILYKDIKGIPVTKDVIIPNHYMKNKQVGLNHSSSWDLPFHDTVTVNRVLSSDGRPAPFFSLGTL